jgi:UDP-N-acetylglucosamine 1-carboxyvinyltransferase
VSTITTESQALPVERTSRVEQFVIEGGVPVSGVVQPEGNKNAALPIIAAALLSDETVRLTNVPRIRDVENMARIVESIGAEVSWTGQNELEITSRELSSTSLDQVLSEKIRASVLVAGPLLARVGHVEVPPPGGDVIGRRRLDTHLHAFEGLGATIASGRTFVMSAPSGLRGARVFLDEASVTATENAVMAAVLAKGTTTLLNAACEPHVVDLCRMLLSMGAQISGIGSNVLLIDGVDRLGGCEYRIQPDHIEVGSFVGIAAATNGELTVEGVREEDYLAITHHFAKIGVDLEFDGDRLHIAADQRLRVRNDVGEMIPKIDSGTWPQFPADLTSIALAVATQAEGTVLIHEKMFENRLVFTDKLVAMGAKIILCDPHRAVVVGPSRLYGARVDSPDIRAGMAMLLAGLAAEGTTIIGNIAQIDRGYERIDERLRALGARIERVAV